MNRDVDRWKRPPPQPDLDEAGVCKVHHRALTYDEYEDGGCTWCATAAAAAESLPLLAGGEE
jgi:hypothetical protein